MGEAELNLVLALLKQIGGKRGIKCFTAEGQALFRKRKGRLAGGPAVERIRKELLSKKYEGKYWHYQKFSLKNGKVVKED